MPSLYHRMHHTSEKPAAETSWSYGTAPAVRFLLFEVPSVFHTLYALGRGLLGSPGVG